VFPYVAGAGAADVGSMWMRSGAGPQELHLVPGPMGWALVREGSEQPLGAFGDLGAALDAATAGPGRVRVVVHGRKER